MDVFVKIQTQTLTSNFFFYLHIFLKYLKGFEAFTKLDSSTIY